MDYNFFEGSGKAKKKKSNTVFFLVIGVAALAFIGLGSITLLNFMENNRAKEEMDTMRKEMEENQINIQNVAKKEAQMNAIAETVKYLEALDNAAMDSRTVNTEVLDYIMGEIPDGIILSNLTISNRALELQFTSDNYWIISQLQKDYRNLKKKGTDINVFTDIEIPNISAESSTLIGEPELYSFSIKMNINFSLGFNTSVSSADTLNGVAVNANEEGVILR